MVLSRGPLFAAVHRVCGKQHGIVFRSICQNTRRSEFEGLAFLWYHLVMCSTGKGIVCLTRKHISLLGPGSSQTEQAGGV